MRIKYIFSDFDGTLTEKGQLGSHFLELIKLCKRKRYELIIVSGRSVSWGHFFLTHFPINFCVMESGGAICYKDKNHEIKTKVLASQVELDVLKETTSELKKIIPEVVFSEDNVGRISDRAIELRWLSKNNNRNKIQVFLKEKSFHFTTSNVHLNYSSTSNNKWNGTCYLIQKIMKKKLPEILKCAIYFGDAPNDEVMFQHFLTSVAVGNIKPYIDLLTFKPKIIQNEREILGVIKFLNSLNSKKNKIS